MRTGINMGMGLAAGAVALAYLVAASGLRAQQEVFPTPPAEPREKIQEGVQITELGCMRTLVAFSEGAQGMDKLVNQRLSEVDFRVFPTAHRTVKSKLSPKDLQDLGNDRKADLVLFVDASARLKNSLGNFKVYEGEATVQFYSPISEELLVTHTVRTTGTRHTDEVEAERSAIEKAVDAAAKEAIAKSLEKAHKILVHEAQFAGVEDNAHALAVMEYMQRMQGVYHVRQLEYDRKNGVLIIEIIASPKTESFWRTYLEQMPKKQKIVYVKAPELHQKYPGWFTE